MIRCAFILGAGQRGVGIGARALSVSGISLVDAKGNAVQLKGVSTHGIAWFPEYINKEAFKNLRDDWGANRISTKKRRSHFSRRWRPGIRIVECPL